MADAQMAFVQTAPPPLARLSAFSPGYGRHRLVGFGIFFPAAALFALLLVLPFLSGLPAWARLPPVWHATEAVFGYGGAVLAGFVLSAMPNWTGRPLPAGRVVLALFALWLMGRIAMIAAALSGASAIAFADLALPLGLLLFAARETLVSGNRRTRKIAIVLALFCAARPLAQMGAETGLRLAVTAQMTLIMLIAGRMIPVFTASALGNAARPIPRFSKFDAIAIIAAVIALLLWALVPAQQATALPLTLAAILQAIRLCRWRGHLAMRHPAIASLHLAYGFIPLGFGLSALALVRPDIVDPGASLHAFTIGAMGTVSLAIMIRTIEGWIGAPWFSALANSVIPGCAALSACLRIAYGFYPDMLALQLSGLFWITAFSVFLVLYGPLLTKTARTE
ncbi:NnrS family protein [Pelagibacterium sediminicola]|uniref:NnrS family protein n=1 Tax=Pelagibacterium sediminicola TaxID=2248761 RepID=UPI000E321E00|nr:NnrS family protein [Pelagibacterium sediminicola]